MNSVITRLLRRVKGKEDQKGSFVERFETRLQVVDFPCWPEAKFSHVFGTASNPAILAGRDILPILLAKERSNRKLARLAWHLSRH